MKTLLGVVIPLLVYFLGRLIPQGDPKGLKQEAYPCFLLFICSTY